MGGMEVDAVDPRREADIAMGMCGRATNGRVSRRYSHFLCVRLLQWACNTMARSIKRFSAFVTGNNSGKMDATSMKRTPSNVTEVVKDDRIEDHLDVLVPPLLFKHPFLSSKDFYYPIVRKNVWAGIEATQDTLEYWQRTAKYTHTSAMQFMNSVNKSLSQNELNTMRTCMARLHEINTARVEITLNHCKEILARVVVPGKTLVKHIKQSVSANDEDVKRLLSVYDAKEKTVKRALDAHIASEKSVEQIETHIVDHRSKLLRQYAGTVSQEGGCHTSFRGFLKKKGSGSGVVLSRRNWKERLFVLDYTTVKGTGRQYLLKYFSADSNEPQGSFLIDKTTVVSTEMNKDKYTNAFQITTETVYFDTFHGDTSGTMTIKDRMKTTWKGTSKPKQRSTLVLQAATDKDRQQWIQHLNAVVAEGMEPMTSRPGTNTVRRNSWVPVTEQHTRSRIKSVDALRDTRAVELADMLEQEQSRSVKARQELDWATEALEAHSGEHRDAMGRVIRNLLRVEMYRNDQQKVLMQVFSEMESEFFLTVQPLLAQAKTCVTHINPQEDIEFLVRNFMGCHPTLSGNVNPLGQMESCVGRSTASGVPPWDVITGNRPILSTEIVGVMDTHITSPSIDSPKSPVLPTTSFALGTRGKDQRRRSSVNIMVPALRSDHRVSIASMTRRRIHTAMSSAKSFNLGRITESSSPEAARSSTVGKQSAASSPTGVATEDTWDGLIKMVESGLDLSKTFLPADPRSRGLSVGVANVD